MFLLHSRTSFNLIRNPMFHLLLQLQNMSIHLFYILYLLKLNTFYLALKLLSYLIIHHSHHRFNLHSKINDLLLKTWTFTKTLRFRPLNLFLKLKMRITIQSLRLRAHLFAHLLYQHLNFRSSQSSFTYRTLDSNPHRKCSEIGF